jgi:HlyD family secretion protein
MKHWKRILAIVIGIAVVAAGGFWFYQSRAASQGTSSSTSSGTYTQIVEVTRGDLTATVSVVGQLQAVRQVEMTFEHMSGTAELKELNVKVGQEVKAGDLLAAIDPTPYQQALEEAQAALQAAEETLKDLETPPTELEIAQADLAVAKAQVQLEQARAKLEDLLHPDIAELETKLAQAKTSLAQAQDNLASLQQQESSFKDKLQKLLDAEAKAYDQYSRLASEQYSDEYHQDRLQLALNKFLDAQDARITAEIQRQIDLLKAQLQVIQAEQSVADAEEALAEARAGGDAVAVAQARVAVQEAEVALQKAQQDRDDLTKGPDETKLATARADVEKKRLAFQDAQQALEGTKLVAPFDGTVLAVNVSAGDRVSPNTVVLVLADLRELEVVASVDETAIRQVQAGQPAVITFDALPGKEFQGQVKEVPLQGQLQGGVTVYAVPITLEGAEGQPLLVGMTANVVIQVGQVKNALLVPALALQRVSGAYQVLVDAGNGETVAVPVEVGLSDGTYTQIVRGLNEGDRVVVQMTAGQSNLFGQMRAFMGPEAGGPPPAAPGAR